MEFIRINHKLALPTRLVPLNPKTVQYFEPHFVSGNLQRIGTIDLVEIDGNLLATDGSHRLSLTIPYPTDVIGILYKEGDPIIDYPYPRVNTKFIEAVLDFRKKAERNGFNTFEDLWAKYEESPQPYRWRFMRFFMLSLLSSNQHFSKKVQINRLPY